MLNWIEALVHKLGATGVFLLMLLENVFPPIPSELVLPLAGYLAAKGDSSLALMVLAGTAGSVAGATIWYWIGRLVGIERLARIAERHGRWLTLTPSEVRHAAEWFDRHGRWTVLVGRMIPGVRSLISVPAGMARMPLPPFLILTSVGSLAWSAGLAVAGYKLGKSYDLVAQVIGPTSNILLAAVIVWYIYRVLTFKRVR